MSPSTRPCEAQTKRGTLWWLTASRHVLLSCPVCRAQRVEQAMKDMPKKVEEYYRVSSNTPTHTSSVTHTASFHHSTSTHSHSPLSRVWRCPVWLCVVGMAVAA